MKQLRALLLFSDGLLVIQSDPQQLVKFLLADILLAHIYLTNE